MPLPLPLLQPLVVTEGFKIRYAQVSPAAAAMGVVSGTMVLQLLAIVCVLMGQGDPAGAVES
jgi:hypothetical protein